MVSSSPLLPPITRSPSAPEPNLREPNLARCTLMALALSLTRASAAEPVDAETWAARARDAAARDDLVTLLEAASAAARLRPDHPRHLYNHAVALAANAQPIEAAKALHQIVLLGLYAPAAENPAFEPYVADETMAYALARLADNQSPRGQVDEAFRLPSMTGLVEGLAYDEPTKRWFFSDVHHRMIWVRQPDGSVAPFTQPDARVPGLTGLAIDAPRGLLWAAALVVPQMGTSDAAAPEQGGLASFDLVSGELHSWHPVPADTQLGDLLVTRRGTVFATDSASGMIWRLNAPDATPYRWRVIGRSSERHSLQGLATLGDDSWLLVADYPSGLYLLSVVDPDQPALPVTIPLGATWVGIDGLRSRKGTVLALQNGVRPARVLRLDFTPGNGSSDTPQLASWEEITAGAPAMPDPTLGQFVGADFVFLGDPGWALFAAPAAPARPRDITVLKVPLIP